jgi:hypothetical protein
MLVGMAGDETSLATFGERYQRTPLKGSALLAALNRVPIP